MPDSDCDHYVALCHALFGGDDVLSQFDLKDTDRFLVQEFNAAESEIVEKFAFCPKCGEKL